MQHKCKWSIVFFYCLQISWEIKRQRSRDQSPSPGPEAWHLSAFLSITYRLFWLQIPSASENTKRTYICSLRPKNEVTRFASSQPHQGSPARMGMSQKFTHSQELVSTFPTSIPLWFFSPSPSVWAALETKGLGPDFKRENFFSMPIHTCHSHGAEKCESFGLKKERENMRILV